MKKNNQDGYSTPFMMIIIFISGILIMGFALYAMTVSRKISTYKNSYMKENNIDEISDRILNSFQHISECKIDSDFSAPLQELLHEYNDINLSIKDCSTGINKNFLSKSILEDKSLVSFLNTEDDSIYTSYGWINSEFADKEYISKLEKRYKKQNLFPLCNSFPLFNIYYMSPEFMEAILSVMKIQNANEKAIELYGKIDTELSNEEIAEILNVDKSHRIFNMICTKTTFWEIYFDYEGKKQRIVIAGIPDNEKKGKIKKYEIVERGFSEKESDK